MFKKIYQDGAPGWFTHSEFYLIISLARIPISCHNGYDHTSLAIGGSIDISYIKEPTKGQYQNLERIVATLKLDPTAISEDHPFAKPPIASNHILRISGDNPEDEDYLMLATNVESTDSRKKDQLTVIANGNVPKQAFLRSKLTTRSDRKIDIKPQLMVFACGDIQARHVTAGR